MTHGLQRVQVQTGCITGSDRCAVRMIENVKIAAAEAKIAYEAKLEEERRAAEEAERIAREKAEAEAAAAAQAEAAAAQQAEKELLASLIFCEAGTSRMKDRLRLELL